MKSVKAIVRFVADLLIVGTPVLLRDGAVLAGAASITYGAWLIYRPAGFIVGGVLLIIGVGQITRNRAG